MQANSRALEVPWTPSHVLGTSRASCSHQERIHGERPRFAQETHHKLTAFFFFFFWRRRAAAAADDKALTPPSLLSIYICGYPTPLHGPSGGRSERSATYDGSAPRPMVTTPAEGLGPKASMSSASHPHPHPPPPSNDAPTTLRHDGARAPLRVRVRSTAVTRAIGSSHREMNFKKKRRPAWHQPNLSSAIYQQLDSYVCI